MASAVSMQEITVRFDQVLANQNVNFEANWGEVHGLVGENGAGKTTLMRVLYGMYTHYEGDVYINGEKVRFASPKDAIAKGIGMVHQHFSRGIWFRNKSWSKGKGFDGRASAKGGDIESIVSRGGNFDYG